MAGAVDTNVLVRAAMRDDPAQSPLAIARLAAGAFVPVTVLLETEWVLRSLLRMPRTDIADWFEALLSAESIVVAAEAEVRWALARCRLGGDFADMLHVALSAAHPPFATFDRAIAGRVGDASPTPVETLA